MTQDKILEGNKLPDLIVARIENESISDSLKAWEGHHARTWNLKFSRETYREGYLAGGKSEATRSQVLVQALSKIRNRNSGINTYNGGDPVRGFTEDGRIAEQALTEYNKP